jgi:hypothetical protein
MNTNKSKAMLAGNRSPRRHGGSLGNSGIIREYSCTFAVKRFFQAESPAPQ